ncbi:MAG: hypothetical protein QI197_07370 [Candidatus Korarchaeota archaeon]|nr:hypothetical protein [Candidatus Korarchaeota archaeon]
MIRELLPGFLKVKMVLDIADAIEDVIADLINFAKILPFRTPNGSPEVEDLMLAAADRGLFRYPNETDEAFRERLANFGIDVRLWGTELGLRKELEYAGFTVDSFIDFGKDDDRWILHEANEEQDRSEDELSHLFNDEDDEMEFEAQYGQNVRATRIWEGDERFIFWVNAQNGDINLAKNILKMVKPAFTKAYLTLGDITLEVE